MNQVYFISIKNIIYNQYFLLKELNYRYNIIYLLYILIIIIYLIHISNIQFYQFFTKLHIIIQYLFYFVLIKYIN